MNRTVTVPGAGLSDTIASLESRGCEIRALTKGDTNGVWIIEFDDMKEANEQPEIFIK